MQYHTISNQKATHAGIVLRGLNMVSDPAEVTGPRKFLPLIGIILLKGEGTDRLLSVNSLCGVKMEIERSRERDTFHSATVANASGTARTVITTLLPASGEESST